jgi:hypothetical protein
MEYHETENLHFQPFRLAVGLWLAVWRKFWRVDADLLRQKITASWLVPDADLFCQEKYRLLAGDW